MHYVIYYNTLNLELISCTKIKWQCLAKQIVYAGTSNSGTNTIIANITWVFIHESKKNN